ncbi:unnamed protein product [Cylindrotheca closterium]|uniref:Uncharacterized protein n=1 Tax=Cylindrotheca closterium TaxID=2856 RepID=A0AAD2JKS4_9STRA|nr:unnamed protein product [Cylindrotheca closterium]
MNSELAAAFAKRRSRQEQAGSDKKKKLPSKKLDQHLASSSSTPPPGDDASKSSWARSTKSSVGSGETGGSHQRRQVTTPPESTHSRSGERRQQKNSSKSSKSGKHSVSSAASSVDSSTTGDTPSESKQQQQQQRPNWEEALAQAKSFQSNSQDPPKKTPVKENTSELPPQDPPESAPVEEENTFVASSQTGEAAPASSAVPTVEAQDDTRVSAFKSTTGAETDDSSSEEDEREEPRFEQSQPSLFASNEGFAAFPQDFSNAEQPQFEETPASNFASLEGATLDKFEKGPDSFGATFESFPADFAGTQSAFAAKDEVVVDGYVPPSFELPTSSAVGLVDKSPIEDPPVIPKPSKALRFENKEKGCVKIYTNGKLPTAPTANPLNGNVILAKRDRKDRELTLCEFNPHTKVQVASIPVLSMDLQRKVAEKFNVSVIGVDNVVTIACGLHTSSSGQTRARVGCLLDLLVLENNEVLRVIATWQWGYAGSIDSIQLQSLLSPPSGSDFSYNATSLLVADSCIFVSGASAKGPCVFLSKPTVRETWTANFVGKDPTRIASMAVTTTTISTTTKSKPQRLPYLAIGLTDGSLSIWTYQAATAVNSKTTETLRRLLYPLCRLDVRSLKKASATKLSGVAVHDGDTAADANVQQTGEIGYCTRLEWSGPNPTSSPIDTLLILVAAFQGGVLFYHVSLPKIKDKAKRAYVELKAPTNSTQLGSTIVLHPVAATRWPAVYHKTAVSFVDVGAHMPLTVAVLATGLSTNLEYSRLGLVSCILAPYKGSVKDLPSGTVHVWDSCEWSMPKSSADIPPSELMSCTNLPGVLYFSSTGLEVLRFSRFAHCIMRNPTSIPFGLSTSGTTYWGDAVSDKAGTLHVYTTCHCERRKVVYGEGSSEYLEWSVPGRRHWLIQTACGDCKEAVLDDVNQRVKQKKDDDTVYGGTYSKVLVELTPTDSASNLIPFRISRDFQGLYIAVWFENIIDGTQRIALVERVKDIMKVAHWFKDEREIVFLPNAMDEDEVTPIPQMLVVNSNGGSVNLWCRKQRKTSSKHVWQPAVGVECRPILGLPSSDQKGGEKVDIESQYVDVLRMTTYRSQDQVGLLVAGRGQDRRVCILAGPLQPDDDLVWSDLLPNLEGDPCIWLEEDEELCLVVPLPGEKAIRGGIAIGSTKRIMVLSASLEIIAQVDVSLPPTSLVPLGSFTVGYCSQDDHAIKYLSGVPSAFGCTGLIASLPLPRHTYSPHLILAVRPDRIIYTCYHNGSRLVERGQSTGIFMLPSATTRPALLLEPMVANAIATGGGAETATQPFFRTVIEKFGRKVSTMTHGDNEGIGNLGAGLTPKVFDLLEQYGLEAAASWLLTGTVNFGRSTNSRLLPSWMPVSAKAKAAMGDADTLMHIIANGDQYFSEYIKSPDSNMASTLPRPTDPSAFLSNGYGMNALKQGNFVDAMKLLDIAGTENSDAMVLQLSLALQMDHAIDATPVLEALSQSHDLSQIGKSIRSTNAASLAALSLELRKNMGIPNDDFRYKWIRPLAPSFQRGKKFGRLRPRIIGESAFSKMSKQRVRAGDELFATETSEMKLVWNEGPNKEKENLLVLDNMHDWFGRRKPAILGKEGVKSAEVRGATTLADILRKEDDDSFGDQDEDETKDGWVDGVGEGLKDEDKLSAYFRLSEGDDEESGWRTEGFADITKFENRAILVGCGDTTALEVSTSSVDEGESGKVKALYDLVFEESGVGIAAALGLPAPRGGSLDIGMMHSPDHLARQKCSMEFWFWVPASVKDSIVLMRRTYGVSADNLESVCKASDKASVLWELILSTNGELEFRTVSGSSLKTTPHTASDDDDEEEEIKSTIRFGYWNHVCLTFKQESMTSSKVNVFVKGASAISDTLNFAPPKFEIDDFSGAAALDPLLEKSYVAFALDHPAGFRIAELRAWALERAADDIRTMMTEYLYCAEIKKKFAVRIKKKGGASAKVGLLARPKGREQQSTTPQKGLLAPPKGSASTPTGMLAPPRSSEKARPRKGLLAPPKADEREESKIENAGFGNEGFGFGHSDFGATESVPPTFQDTAANAAFSADAFGGFGSKDSMPVPFNAAFGEGSNFETTGPISFVDQVEEPGMETFEESPEISPLWDSAIPLSEQVRSSATAALIRGPPATRHFGGNRGGLPDYRELERFGVGAISICGSEKTIVWRDDQIPPGLTYPIGASGAIVSDQMDEDGSEFLCCFLAKDKRMVVFELSTRTVVVELQMTTKLNFWRFLPPEAGEDTLCFMLVTPVGGFHWMPLDESPRPRQVWKRGPELQGKKIVCYEEGGTNGLDGPDMLSKVGMLLVTNTAVGGSVEAWLVPICGDSLALCAHDNVLGACLCSPPDIGYEAWMPLLLFVVEAEEDLVVCISAVTETSEVSIGLTEVMTDALIELGPYKGFDYEPPTLAMGNWPEVLCCSLGTTIVIIVRKKGLVVAYELAETGLELIAQENVGHFVVDAVMRYSAAEGGAEIVLLMSDEDNPKDGRVGTFCFRTAL